jgi:hypothetical protein
MKESQIKGHLQKGWIRAIVTFEVVGKPAKHVEQSLKEYLDNIRKDERIIFLREEREPAVEHDGVYSAISETELLVKSLETFTWLCINFSPASVEILEPDEHRIKARDVTNWLNDLLSMVHEIGANYRSHKSANEHLTIAMNELIRNAILLSLREGQKDSKAIAHDIGIADDLLEPFLKHLVEKKKILHEKSEYRLPEGAKFVFT